MIDGADAAIEVGALTKRYPGGVVALDAIDLRITRGTITAILGANGSGKSTLVKVLAGLVPADEGSVRVLGADPALRPAALRARTGYVAQGVELDPEMSGAETLRLFATLHGIGPAGIENRIAALTEAFGLREHLPRRVGTWSGGLRQRLHIAVGFIHEPELIFLDEPTASLDPAGRADVWQLIERSRDQGHTIVLITHDTIEAARHCETVALLHRGRVAAVGSPRELVARRGSWALDVQLSRSVTDDVAVLGRSALPIASRAPLVRGHRLILYFDADDAIAAPEVKRLVIDRLEAAGETILGFRLDPPDLASAYFDLTNDAIESPEHPERRRGAVSGAADQRSRRSLRRE